MNAAPQWRAIPGKRKKPKYERRQRPIRTAAVCEAPAAAARAKRNTADVLQSISKRLSRQCNLSRSFLAILLYQRAATDRDDPVAVPVNCNERQKVHCHVHR